VDDTDTTGSPTIPELSAPWTPSRVLALAGGALILFWITKRSYGFSLVPLLGILIAVQVQRGRGKRVSMFLSWFVASLSASIGIAGFMVFGFSKLPPGFLSRTMDSVIVAQQHAPPPKLPPVLEKLQRDDSVSRAAREQAQAMVRNPKFLAPMIVVGMMMGCAILGIILGTISWASGLLLARGFTGAWPFRKEPEVAYQDMR
jgi:hypothetical protein